MATGNFTVLVNKDGELTGPFIQGGSLDFISKNSIATDAEVNKLANTAKQEAIDAAAIDATTKANTAESNAKSYTDDEIDKLEQLIAAIKTFTVVIPEDGKLPETGEPKVIYLIPEVDAEGNILDTKAEYLWINGKFELIGTTHVSLAGYATETYVDDKISAAKEELTEAIASSQERITVTSTVDIGGIKKDTTFTDKTNAQLWDELLNKELFPTLIGPSSSFSSTVTGLKEVGELISSIKFTSTFNRGSIDPQYKSETPYRAGLPTNRAFVGTDLAGNDTSNSLIIEKTISSYTVVKGVQSWSCTVSYGKGTQPKTNKDNNYDSALAAGSLDKQSVSITGTYPFFATTSSITSTTKQSLVKLDTTSIKATMVGCTDTNFWVLEVPACWTITNVTGAASGQLGGNATNAVAQWAKTNIVKTIQGNNIKYYRYAYGANNAPKKGADTLTFSIKYDSTVSLSTTLAEGKTWE